MFGGKNNDLRFCNVFLMLLDEQKTKREETAIVKEEMQGKDADHSNVVLVVSFLSIR